MRPHFLLLAVFCLSTLNAHAFEFNDLGSLFGGNSCILNEEDDIPGEAKALFESAQENMQKGDACKAANLYLAVVRQYPEKAVSVDAQFLVIDALFQAGIWDGSIIAAKEYIMKFGHRPGDERVEYAYYMVGNGYFQYVPKDERFDTSAAAKAQRSFTIFLDRYPNSPWVEDAKKKLETSRNVLAAKEISVGRYHLERKNYKAALVRLQNVPRDYKSSAHTPESLYLLIDCYLGLGKEDEAKAARMLLERFYPDSDWTKKAPEIFEKWTKAGGAKSRAE